VLHVDATRKMPIGAQRCQVVCKEEFLFGVGCMV